MVLAAAAIFSSAFLLFIVQPMIGKAILPSYGGVPAVWSACLVFFQSALLLGYWGAHLLVTRCGPRSRIVWYGCAAVLASVSALRVIDASFTPSATMDLSLSIFIDLALTIGGAYVVLSATSPLLQGVLGATSQRDSVYRLYAVSNVGSLGSLLAYPFFVEPHLVLASQAYWWGWGVVGATALIALTLIRTSTAPSETTRRESAAIASPPPSQWDCSLWMALSACGTIILLSGTTYLSQDIAPVPLLWVVPLALYLITYILAFSAIPLGSSILWLLPLGGSVILLTHPQIEPSLSLEHRLLLSCGGIFFALMSCHVELARRRPSPNHLTSFFFLSSFGGVLGGIWVSFIAPRIYTNHSELFLGLLLCAALGIVSTTRVYLLPRWPAVFRVSSAALIGASIVLPQILDSMSNTVASRRNFFGIVRISDVTSPPPHRISYRRMSHGTTTHGIQILEENRALTPTTYYGRESAVGLILSKFRRNTPRSIGVIGLGAGTLASYGTSNDTFTFYEINPAVVDLARDHFSFIQRSAARSTTVLGDARLTLSADRETLFDILVVDAFSSDSIPAHLMTKEAFELYFRKLSLGGVLVIHISNRYLTLAPVVSAIAGALNKSAWYAQTGGDPESMVVPSLYMVIPTVEAEAEVHSIIPGAPRLNPPKDTSRYLWTDSYSNILSVMNLREKKG